MMNSMKIACMMLTLGGKKKNPCHWIFLRGGYSMYDVGDLYEVKGERLILKEQDSTSYMFWARKFNRHISKNDFMGMIESGEATLIREGKEVQQPQKK